MSELSLFLFPGRQVLTLCRAPRRLIPTQKASSSVCMGRRRGVAERWCLTTLDDNMLVIQVSFRLMLSLHKECSRTFLLNETSLLAKWRLQCRRRNYSIIQRWNTLLLKRVQVHIVYRLLCNVNTVALLFTPPFSRKKFHENFPQL